MATNIQKEVIRCILLAGDRLKKKAGKVKDIGVKKKYLTAEDIRIENELRDIIQRHNPNHKVYAEEKNNHFHKADDVWVIDPISGTNVFLSGQPNYAIVVSHVNKGVVQFAVTYLPATDTLYTAYRNGGAYRNDQRLVAGNLPKGDPLRIAFSLSFGWKKPKTGRIILNKLSRFELYRQFSSHAVTDCLVASGVFDGVVILAKDSFPYFAGSLIVQEAGGVYTNIDMSSNICHQDRLFIAGNKDAYQKLLRIVRETVKQRSKKRSKL